MRKPFGVKLTQPDLVFPKGADVAIEHALYICFKHLLCPKDKNNALEIKVQLPPHRHFLKDKHLSLS